MLRHRVTHYTLCPLGEPEIAIGHEPRIEPWFTLNRSLACRSLELDGIATIRAEETYEHGQSVKLLQRSETSVLQWAGSREKKSRLRSRQNFFLDIPFYRTH